MCLLPRPDIEQLISVYAKALADHGATPKGVRWPNATDLPKRFRSLLRPIDFGRYSPSNRMRLLDLGCGPGFLLDYLAQQDLLERVDYCGVDVYKQPLELARARWPDHRFERRDVRDQPFEPGAFDYCVVCGVFTGRWTTTTLPESRWVLLHGNEVGLPALAAGSCQATCIRGAAIAAGLVSASRATVVVAKARSRLAPSDGRTGTD